MKNNCRKKERYKFLFPNLSKNYKTFTYHIDRIASEIVDELDEYVISFSGGIDCTLILASLLKNGADPKKIMCIHVDLSKRNRYYAFHKQISKHIAEKTGVKLVVVPPSKTGRIIESAIEFFGFSTFLHGDGLDRMYCKSYKKDYETGIHFSHGERFRTRHPYIDYLTATLPHMILVHGKHVDSVDTDYISRRFDDFEADNNCRMIRYGKDKQLAHFMYKISNSTNFYSWFFWKSFNKWYVEDSLGVSHHNLCREAMKTN